MSSARKKVRSKKNDNEYQVPGTPMNYIREHACPIDFRVHSTFERYVSS